MSLDTIERLDISKILKALDKMTAEEKIALFKILDSYREVLLEDKVEK